MSLFEVLLSAGLADHRSVARLRDAARLERRQRRRETYAAERRIDALEDDLGFVTLVLASLLCKLDEQGSVTQDDVRALVAELDDVDGVRDGRLDVNLLKELTAE